MTRHLCLSPVSSSRLVASTALLGALGFSLVACGGGMDPVDASQDAVTAGDADDSAADPALGGNGDDAAEEGPGDGKSPPAACAQGMAAPFEPGGSCQAVGGGLCFENAELACECAGCELIDCALAESFPVQAICQTSGPGVSDPDAPVSDTGAGDDGDDSGVSPGSAGGGVSGSPGSSGGGVSSSPGGAGAACDAGFAPAPDGIDQNCQFVVGEMCFDTAEPACACAGCGEPDACLILESFPAQIRCL